MSLGSAILRPQALANPPAEGEMRAFDLLVELIECLVKNAAVTEALATALQEVMVPRLETFLLTRHERMRLAEGRMRSIFSPFSDLFTDFLESMDESITDTLPGALEMLRGLVGLLGTENLGHLLRELIDMAETDLEINGEAVEDLFRDVMGATVANLRQPVNDGDLSEEALARYEMGTHLLSLEQLLLEELDWPPLDKDVLVEALADLGRQSGWDRILGDLERLLGNLLELVEPLATLLEATFSVRVDASLERRGNPSLETPNGDTTVTQSAPLSFYATWVLRTPTRFEIDESTTRIGPIAAITYKNLEPHKMEEAAFHTLWIADLVESLLHFISVEGHDIAVNMLNGLWNLGNTLATPLNKEQLPSWAHWVAMPSMTILGGLESGRFQDACGDDPYLWTIMLGDVGETVLYRRWTWLAREFVLSTMTLSNHDPAAYATWKREREQQPDLVQGQARIAAIEEELENPPRVPTSDHVAGLKMEKERLEADIARIRWEIRQGGHNQFHGFCYFFAELFGMLLPLILAFTDRLNYGFVGGGPTAAMVGKVFGGFGISLVAGWFSLLLARPIAGQRPDDDWNMILLPAKERFLWNPREHSGGEITGRVFWVVFSLVIEWAMQGIYLYLFTNGNTSGGDFTGIPGNFEFPGYPGNPGNSPYRLPYPSGEDKECVQNPLGIWSHFPNSGQTYAIDFNHDAGADVSNSRTGVVTSLIVGNPNNNPNNWNGIEIMALRVLAAGTTGNGVFPGVPPPSPPGPSPPGPPPVTTYTDTTIAGAGAIEPGTLFPPYWDVNGNPWPLLPNPMWLHPSQAILPAGSAFTGGVAANSTFAFLDPNYDRGLNARTYPAGATFSDGTTPIPPGVVFAPDAPNPPALSTPFYLAGTTFAPIQQNFTAAPFLTGTAAVAAGVPGFSPPPGSTFLDGRPIPAGVDLPPDCGANPLWLPNPHPATPMYLAGTQFVPITSNLYFNAGTGFVSVGTTFPAIPPTPPGGAAGNLNVQWMTPMVFAFCDYGHAIAGFTSIPNFTWAVPPGSAPGTPPAVIPLPAGAARVAPPGEPAGPLTDVFGTSNNNAILGRLIPQGQVIMLAGDTGVSAYNHLHTHVTMDARINQRTTFTIPFVYADVVHGIQHGFREAPEGDGVPRAMTWYTSRNPS